MTNNEKTTNAWQEEIFVDCERILKRQLIDVETSFVRKHEGFVAIEKIEGSLSELDVVELSGYLNSDNYD